MALKREFERLLARYERWSSLPAMFFEQAEALGDRPFLWRKVEDAYRPTSWRDAAEQARALALFYLMDLSAEEVGRALGRTPEAVSSLLQRARANALEALQGREVRRRGRPRKGGKA